MCLLGSQYWNIPIIEKLNGEEPLKELEEGKTRTKGTHVSL